MGTYSDCCRICLKQLLILSICVFTLTTCDVHYALDDLDSERQRDVKSHLFSRHPRDAIRRTRKKVLAERFGSALYFNGNAHPLKLRFLTKEGKITLPNEHFTVQFWAKPEGGQSSYTPIVDLYDECDMIDQTGSWTVGIGQKDQTERRDARFVFSLQTEDSKHPSHLYAHKLYDPDEWTNVAASYDGATMSLYLNGAKISLGHEQKGIIYSQKFSKCKLMFIGNVIDDDPAYRGKVDEFRLWNRTLDHSEIVKNMHTKGINLPADNMRIISDSFNNLDKWRVRKGLEPKIVKSDIPASDHHIRFEAPPCGKTVCDDPQLVQSYLNNSQLRSEKKVRYGIVNIKEDDGSNPTITDKEMFEQHKALSKAFADYNITFEFEEHEVRNSSIRQREILFDCVSYDIGDGTCQEGCGRYDGGDCDEERTLCDKALLGNGVCNPDCNKVYHNYDNGDCCQPGADVYQTCIDPTHPSRGFINIEDIKMDLQLDGSSQINIFFITAGWYRNLFRGVATYPWNKNVYTSVGGNIVHESTFGSATKLESLVHEFGHNLGLWHVHRGISETRCDECTETHPSMVLGDLCSDTNPTPRNRLCRDPRPDIDSQFDNTCGIFKFDDTPYNNYMSYADDTCTDHFTPQQVARMHCYLDLVYQPMREMKTPNPVPLAPKVIRADTKSVSMVWLEPLDAGSSCDSDNSLYQYADVAASSHTGIRWSPQEATGFPDAEQCLPSRYAWMPFFSDFQMSCEDRSCWLELGFKTPVVPKRIRIWISDLEVSTDLAVELIGTDGRSEDAGTIPAFCDMETSLPVDTKNLIDKVRIYTSTSYVAVDAVEMVSSGDHAACLKVRYPKYRLTRQPPFDGGHVVTADTEYTDRDVEAGLSYSYHVQSVLGAIASVDSPTLAYTHGQPFCGDGIVTAPEECDDQNALDGDGCSIQCHMEEGFHCNGEPSLCYIYADDGVCEQFERGSSSRDCGLYTPAGYRDQWAAQADTDPDHVMPECPASAVTGVPDLLQGCGSDVKGDHFWRPCLHHPDIIGDFWLQVTIYQPVVAVSVIVYLASDGATAFSPVSKAFQLHLVTTEGDLVPLDPHHVPLSCHSNPVEVPVVQDISQPFFLTKGVRISFSHAGISIAAVGVRSSPHLNPLALSQCEQDELYNPRHGHCVKQTCTGAVDCGSFPVKYGVADCTGSGEADTCSIECNTGYYVEGHENKAVCVSGAWVTSSPLACAAVDCGRPKVPGATVACPDGTLYTQQCHFKCDRPAVMFGSDSTITCQDDGTWSTQKATCEITCPVLEAEQYENGDLKTTACRKSAQSVGRECKVKCRPGYHVEFERNRKRFLRLTCDVDGLWFGPRCVKNVCPRLPTMFTGAYTCTDSFYSGSTCIMGCPGNLTLFQSVTCRSEGEWNGELTLCPVDATKTCDPPVSTDNVTFDCIDNGVGGKCAVQCTDYDYAPIVTRGGGSSGDAILPSSGFLDEVEKVECTVMRKWEPDPTLIVCEKRCSLWSIGDGICEAVNNRALCDWDGGDCCPSTALDGDVITIPDVCDVDCDCLDPGAVENAPLIRKKRTQP